MSRKRTVVVIATSDVERAAEAMRAAVGLTLRGDAVEVVTLAALADEVASISKAAATLRAFGHTVSTGDRLGDALAGADAVEVWTGGEPVSDADVPRHPGALQLARGRALASSAGIRYIDDTDATELLDLLFEADVAALW